MHYVCSLFFYPSASEAASIIQQHIAEHNATHSIASSPFLFLLCILYLPTLYHFILCHVSTSWVELRICQSLSLAIINICFLFNVCFSRYLLLRLFCIRDFIPMRLGADLPFVLLCPFLIISCWASFEGPEGRRWKGARRKGCGHLHCSAPLCWAGSDTHTEHHTQNRTHAALWSTLCSTFLSLEKHIVFVSGQSVPEYWYTDLFSISCPRLMRHKASMMSRSREAEGLFPHAFKRTWMLAVVLFTWAPVAVGLPNVKKRTLDDWMSSSNTLQNLANDPLCIFCHGHSCKCLEANIDEWFWRSRRAEVKEGKMCVWSNVSGLLWNIKVSMRIKGKVMLRSDGGTE